MSIGIPTQSRTPDSPHYIAQGGRDKAVRPSDVSPIAADHPRYKNGTSTWTRDSLAFRPWATPWHQSDGYAAAVLCRSTGESETSQNGCNTLGRPDTGAQIIHTPYLLIPLEQGHPLANGVPSLRSRHLRQYPCPPPKRALLIPAALGPVVPSAVARPGGV